MTELGELDVSRETIRRLKDFGELLKKWTPKINLISKSTVDDLWTRHIMDSAQIYDLAPHPIDVWADLGSGGGFPGLVIAVIAKETASPGKMILVESDQRKCTFLRTVIRELDLDAEVVSQRIEETAPLAANVISARALADLPALMDFSHPHLAADGTMIFLKGESWKSELQSAQSKWQFTHEIVKSETSENSVIICARGVARV